MTVFRIETHQVDAAARTLQQSRRPKFLALLGCMTSVAQQVEDLAFPLLDAGFVDKAYGKGLDRIGELVGIDRGGQTDDVYRLLLRAKIYSNSSDTTTETLLALVRTVFGAKQANLVAPSSPGHANRAAPAVLGVEVGSPTIDASLHETAVSLLRSSMAAAVRLSFVSIYDAAETFALAGAPSGAGADGKATTLGMATIIFSDPGA